MTQEIWDWLPTTVLPAPHWPCSPASNSDAHTGIPELHGAWRTRRAEATGLGDKGRRGGASCLILLPLYCACGCITCPNHTGIWAPHL